MANRINYSHGMVFNKWIILMVVAFIFYGYLEIELASGKKILNDKSRHAVKTIKSEDGDIIDCVDMYKQIAFSHHALRNHVIQTEPSYDPTAETKSATEAWSRRNGVAVSQIWRTSGSCPKGSIPVRRSRSSGQLEKSSSMEDHGSKKKPSLYSPIPMEQLNDNGQQNLQQPNRSKAILLAYGYRYTGAKGDIRVWSPFVETMDEYSTSRVSLINGPYYDFETIESGWMVNPKVYADNKTRLYVYWTADASKETGCFDLTCPGFVQTSNEIALGAAIYPISSTYGLPYEIIIYIFMDPHTGNWWMQYGEKINVGYWPHELFSRLPHGAESAEWGGEVYSTRVGKSPHTATDMGNGKFPNYVSGNSGSIKRIRIRDNAPMLKFPEWVSAFTDEFNCYRVNYVSDYVEDPEFYYGGPGKNDLCP